MFKPQQGIGHCGQDVPGPPWILGHRGAALEAPENTLGGLRRAIETGVDGCAYDLRATASGDVVLLADATLDRTTDGHGPLALKTLPELHGLDAGGWFSKDFHSEPLALFDEALGLEGNAAGTWPQHLAILRERGLVSELARALTGRGSQLCLRVASVSREACLNARDLGLQPMWLVSQADEEARRFVRDERFGSCGLMQGASGAGAWAPGEWPCERWALGIDRPQALLEACRLPLNGFSTNELRRALATRALVFLAPHDRGPYPLVVPDLVVDSAAELPGPGEWCGHWSLEAQVRNPFGFGVRACLRVVVRRGAFEAQGLPAVVDLEPDMRARVAFELSGGSWSPGGDALLVCDYAWSRGPGRPSERLTLDTPLRRVRETRLAESAVRLTMLREAPEQRRASVTLRRQRADLLAAVENAGGLEDPRLVVHLDGRIYSGSRGLRMPLPQAGAHPLPFSIGFVGTERGRVHVRRWAGGVPDQLDSGSPGHLYLPLLA